MSLALFVVIGVILSIVMKFVQRAAINALSMSLNRRGNAWWKVVGAMHLRLRIKLCK